MHFGRTCLSPALAPVVKMCPGEGLLHENIVEGGGVGGHSPGPENPNLPWLRPQPEGRDWGVGWRGGTSDPREVLQGQVQVLHLCRNPSTNQGGEGMESSPEGGKIGGVG